MHLRGLSHNWLFIPLKNFSRFSNPINVETKRQIFFQPLIFEKEDEEDTETAAWMVDPTAAMQTIVEGKELNKDLHKILGELPGKYRSVLTLIDLYESDYNEAAIALKAPLGTMKSRLARARLKMRKEYLETTIDERSTP
jgi:DNA-directed RNA polymerase specialized sigma24 family protein